MPIPSCSGFFCCFFLLIGYREPGIDFCLLRCGERFFLVSLRWSYCSQPNFFFSFQRLFFLLLLLLLQIQLHNKFLNPFGISGRPYNFVRIFFQILYPAIHISRVLARIMSYAQILREHPRRYFRPQFFPCIRRTSEPSVEIPVQAAFMPRPVPKLMQGSAVISRWIGKLLFFRKNDNILRGSVICSGSLFMFDVRSGISEYCFRFLFGIPGKTGSIVFLCRIGGAVFPMLKLGDIEDAPVFHTGSLKRHSFLFRFAVSSEDRNTVIKFLFFLMELPVNNGLSVFSLFNAISLFIRLWERHIPRLSLVFHCTEP